MYWKNRQRLRILFARSPRLGLGSLMRWKMVSGRQAKRSGMVAMLPKTQSRKRHTRSSRGHYRQWAQFLWPASWQEPFSPGSDSVVVECRSTKALQAVSGSRRDPEDCVELSLNVPCQKLGNAGLPACHCGFAHVALGTTQNILCCFGVAWVDSRPPECNSADLKS